MPSKILKMSPKIFKMSQKILINQSSVFLASAAGLLGPNLLVNSLAGGSDMIGGGGIQGMAASTSSSGSYEHYAGRGFLWSWNFAVSRRWKVRELSNTSVISTQNLGVRADG